jgi:hypothetical protein
MGAGCSMAQRGTDAADAAGLGEDPVQHEEALVHLRHAHAVLRARPGPPTTCSGGHLRQNGSTLAERKGKPKSTHEYRPGVTASKEQQAVKASKGAGASKIRASEGGRQMGDAVKKEHGGGKRLREVSPPTRKPHSAPPLGLYRPRSPSGPTESRQRPQRASSCPQMRQLSP